MSKHPQRPCLHRDEPFSFELAAPFAWPTSTKSNEAWASVKPATKSRTSAGLSRLPSRARVLASPPTSATTLATISTLSARSPHTPAMAAKRACAATLPPSKPSLIQCSRNCCKERQRQRQPRVPSWHAVRETYNQSIAVDHDQDVRVLVLEFGCSAPARTCPSAHGARSRTLSSSFSLTSHLFWDSCACSRCCKSRRELVASARLSLQSCSSSWILLFWSRRPASTRSQ